MVSFSEIIIFAAGLVAGLIDSVAGGGGLITVPLLSILLGPGAIAIGTNKVGAAAGSLFALIVYMRKGHVQFRGNWLFVLWTGIGAALGALVSPLIPPPAYRWILIAICPVILWVVVRKEIWIKEEIKSHVHLNVTKPLSKILIFWLIGFGCGFYDGIAGPGGGTLMFLALFLVARIPLLSAIATAKLANLSSAGLSLATFAYSGHVIWPKGFWLAAGISIGAVAGASLALRHAAELARSALLVVATLLLLRLIFS